jgi:hypothetical protein
MKHHALRAFVGLKVQLHDLFRWKSSGTFWLWLLVSLWAFLGVLEKRVFLPMLGIKFHLVTSYYTKWGSSAHSWIYGRSIVSVTLIFRTIDNVFQKSPVHCKWAGFKWPRTHADKCWLYLQEYKTILNLIEQIILEERKINVLEVFCFLSGIGLHSFILLEYCVLKHLSFHCSVILQLLEAVAWCIPEFCVLFFYMFLLTWVIDYRSFSSIFSYDTFQKYCSLAVFSSAYALQVNCNDPSSWHMHKAHITAVLLEIY